MEGFACDSRIRKGVPAFKGAALWQGGSTIISFVRLKEFFKVHKRYYIVGVFALIVVNSAQLVMPKMLGNLTDLIAEGNFARGNLARFSPRSLLAWR